MGDEVILINRRLLDKNHFCPLCDIKNPALREVKDLYDDWVSFDRIMMVGEVTEGELENHVRAWGWDIERPKNTRRLYNAMLREAAPGILQAGSGKGGTSSKIAVIVAKQMDKLDELEKVRSEPKTEQMERAVLLLMAQATQLMKEGHELEYILTVFDSTMPGLTDLVRQRMGMPAKMLNITPYQEEGREE